MTIPEIDARLAATAHLFTNATSEVQRDTALIRINHLLDLRLALAQLREPEANIETGTE